MLLSEVFAEATDGAAAGFVRAHLAGDRPVLWLQDRLSRRETGRPYLPGLDGLALLLMDLPRAQDVLAAAEEGLGCAALGAVVAEVWGDPQVLDFTATKRLALRAEARGVACWLIRHAARPDLSAARDRWRLRALPSEAHPDDPRAPGAPLWRAELFRSRDRRPGVWTVRHDGDRRDGGLHDRDRRDGTFRDGAAHRLDFAAAVPDGALAESPGAGGLRPA